MEQQFVSVSAEVLEAPRGPLIVAASPVLGRIRLSLVIPTYNERENLPSLLEQLDALLRSVLEPGDFELIVVDDDSPDETWRVAAELRQKISGLRVIRRQGEKGLSTAVLRGWQLARGEILGVMDGDLQHPPEVNLDLLAEMARGADLAVGSRNVEGGGVSDWSFSRRVLSRGAQLLGMLWLPDVVGRLADPLSGYFMVRREAIVGVEMAPLGYKLLLEVLARGRVSWLAEVPYVFRDRLLGDSKVSWRLYQQYLVHLFRLRSAATAYSPIHRYALVGALGVTVDMLFLYLLSDDSMLGMGILRSKLMAAQPAILLTFCLNEFWTFAQLTKERASQQVLRRGLAYFGVAWSMLFAATLIMSALVHFQGLDRYLANAVGIAVVAGLHYRTQRKITWGGLPRNSHSSGDKVHDAAERAQLRELLRRTSDFPPPGP